MRSSTSGGVLGARPFRLGSQAIVGLAVLFAVSACLAEGPASKAASKARYQAKMAHRAALESTLPEEYSSLTAKRAKQAEPPKKRGKPKPSASLDRAEAVRALSKLTIVQPTLVSAGTSVVKAGPEQRPSAEDIQAAEPQPGLDTRLGRLSRSVALYGASINDATVVATWVEDGKKKTITFGQLREARKAAFIKLEQQRYDTTRKELEQHLIESLMEAEATRAGTTVEGLIEKSKKAVTEADIKKFYDTNVARQGKGPPLEQVSDRIRSYLATTRQIEKLKAAAKVKFSVPEPPGVEFDLTGRPSVGANNPKVTIVEFSDFQCPYCARATEPVKKILAAFPNQVKVYFLHFPLSFHKQALPAAIAAKCAQDQGKFWPMHDKIFASQAALADADLEKHAKDLGLNMSAFGTCVKDPKTAAYVQSDMAQGTQAGVSGTPSFYLNGRPSQGIPSVEAVRAIIEG